MKHTITAIALGLAATGTAFAEDNSGNWGGAYGGIQLGYGSGDFDAGTGDIEADGAVGGFHLGYNWDLGDWVVGAEFQFDAADLEVESGIGTGSFDQIARLNLRAGRDLGKGLIYGSAGLAYANFDGEGGAFSADLSDPGYVVGIGYDYKLNDKWTLGGQYQYHVFDDFGADGNDVDFGTAHIRASYNF